MTVTAWMWIQTRRTMAQPRVSLCEWTKRTHAKRLSSLQMKLLYIDRQRTHPHCVG